METSADLVQRLGYLALGTRLKRIGEALQAGVNDAFVTRGIPVQPGQVAILVALSQSPGLTVGELVTELGLSQPGVSRGLGELARAGLVQLSADARDGRVRSTRLTDEGTALMTRIAATLFPRVAAAAAALCEGLKGDFLDGLATIDRRLDEQGFALRIEAVDK